MKNSTRSLLCLLQNSPYVLFYENLFPSKPRLIHHTSNCHCSSSAEYFRGIPSTLDCCYRWKCESILNMKTVRMRNTCNWRRKFNSCLLARLRWWHLLIYSLFPLFADWVWLNLHRLCVRISESHWLFKPSWWRWHQWAWQRPCEGVGELLWSFCLECFSHGRLCCG